MKGGLLAKIREILKRLGMSDDDFEQRLREHGIDYRLPFVDAEGFAPTEHIYIFARILSVPASDLFEETSHLDHDVRTSFNECWPMFKDHVEVPRDVAWLRVNSREFRSQSPSGVRKQVFQTLRALMPSQQAAKGCRYHDCECVSCEGRCVVTGRNMTD